MLLVIFEQSFAVDKTFSFYFIRKKKVVFGTVDFIFLFQLSLKKKSPFFGIFID